MKASLFSLCSDPRCYYHVFFDRSGDWIPGPARSTLAIHWPSDYYTHGSSHWALWVPGCRGESRQTLGHSHAVSMLGHPAVSIVQVSLDHLSRRMSVSVRKVAFCPLRPLSKNSVSCKQVILGMMPILLFLNCFWGGGNNRRGNDAN